MKQLVTPKLNTVGKPGYCLGFVGDDYQLRPRPFPSAQVAWDGAKLKHTDEPPKDVAVPVFYTWRGSVGGVVDNYGDVAIRTPDGRVYGTPKTKDGPGSRWDSSVEARRAWLGGGAKYLGWTEDLNGVRLVEGASDMVTTKSQLNDMYIAVLQRRRDEDHGEGEDVYLGKDSGWVFNQLYESRERVLMIPKKAQELADLKGGIADRDKEIARLKANSGSGNPKADALLKAVQEAIK